MIHESRDGHACTTVPAWPTMAHLLQNLCQYVSIISIHPMLDLYLEKIDRYIELSVTAREQTLERCPNLALASAFFAPGAKGFCPTVVRGAGIFSPDL